MSVSKRTKRQFAIWIVFLLSIFLVSLYLFSRYRKTYEQGVSFVPEVRTSICNSLTESECIAKSSCSPYYDQTSEYKMYTQCIENPLTQEEYDLITLQCNRIAGTIVSTGNDIACSCKTASGENQDCLKDLIDTLKERNAF